MRSLSLALALGLGLAAAAPLGAQSTPKITAPVTAAKKAVAKTNAKLEAEQRVGNDTTKAQPAKPQPAKPAAAPAPKPQPAAPRPQAAERRGPGAEGPAPTLAAADTSARARSTTVAERGGRDEVTIRREVYDYEAGGRRDPFVSLLASGDLRPLISDLRVVAIAYDPTGRNSVAVMRDQSTNDQYRVKVGQTLGRMRVAQIQPKSVTFTIEEFGYSRREELSLGDASSERTQ